MLDEFTRAWNEWLATIADPLWGEVPTLGLITVVAALLVGLLWAYWPAWLPSHWSRSRGRKRRDRERSRRLGRPRLRLRWRLRWRRRRRGTADEESARLPDDEVPDLPAEVLTLTADELAAAGRYAEAVRERLRAILRGLIERDLLPASPGWTVLELARTAGRVRPALAGPVDGAAGVFSEIWYGLRPATAEDDAAMRAHAAAISASLRADQSGPATSLGDLEPDHAAAGRPA